MIMTEEGKISFGEYETYYRIVGKEYKKTPLLMIHGGPGSTHNSFEVIDDFAFYDKRPVIMYDQIGCGLSSIPDDHPELYCKEVWTKELMNLREKLNLKEVHLDGHSWGGMLTIIYMCDAKPKGVKSVTLSSTLSSVRLWDKETHRLLKYLPEDEQEILKDAEKRRDFSSKEAQEAITHYMKMTVGNYSKKSKYTPECLKRTKLGGKVCYNVAWGPSEFRPDGNLKDYEYTSKLKSIKCPTLLISGGNDESTPYQNKVMYEALRCKKKWVLLPSSRHMTYFEKKRSYEKALKDFLDKADEER